MKSFAGWITTCIPNFQCGRYLRRAVESVLAQTYPWVRVVVINDGDPCPPWQQIAAIRDRRLLRFHLPVNRGCYFCREVVRLSTPDPYFMVQDADDWAAPNRAAVLMERLLTERAAFAVSAQPQFVEEVDGSCRPVSLRWRRRGAGRDTQPFDVNPVLSARFAYRMPEHGLIRADTLAKIGGYYGGPFRVGWDVFLMNLVLMTGPVSWTPEPLYHRLVRPQSLTHCAATGAQTTYAREVAHCLRALYQRCYCEYQLFERAVITRHQLCASIRRICARYVSPADKRELSYYAGQLREALRRQ